MIKKTVILSTNDNPDYLGYLPYVQDAWNLLGWNTLTFFHGETTSMFPWLTPNNSGCENKIIDITDRQCQYRVETRVQCIRLLAGHYIEEGLIMTSDVDMIPLSDYWKPSIDQITVYGHDLTGRSQYPMCYIAMNAHMWREIFPEENLIELLDKYPHAKSDNWELWWTIDQQIVTKRLRQKVNAFIDRGHSSNGITASGRVDRYDWAGTLAMPGVKIDAHMPRPFNKQAAENMVELLKNNLKK